MEPKIKWGIIGPGKIARKFASDLLLFEDAEVTAVASRNLERAKSFASDFGIRYVFGSYEELFESNVVDVVYIATPHTFHKELSVKAIQNGKHVLCEKPLGVNLIEVEEIIKVAKEESVFLMEGLWSRFNPSIQKAKELIDNNEIGPISYLHADFSFYALDRGKESRLLNPELASGSLLDIGIYPVFLSYLLLGMPKKIQAQANFLENGTEAQTSILFKYKNALSMLYSGLKGESKMEAEISGAHGEIFVHPRWHEANGLTLKKGEEVEKYNLPTKGNGFVYEIQEVHKCLKNKLMESKLWSHQNSLDLARLLNDIRHQIGAKFPFES
ncbi:Gfo/Idh/MocA family protein [Flagellimonas meridianipacifica]|uniref:Putative dehydrogenase n=1 Tax=Flagellimonas meridianipacifica TaxID=1080225 RepID=A0A2T0MCE2_9FLAO|nr:Gfo/Idh/MocA family oxidoreductase [Allomuricauda pacifica]PRX55160.1 putative dehydrogenase [Allomuricauda pacifica]